MGCLKFPLLAGISETPLGRDDGAVGPRGRPVLRCGAKPRAPCGEHDFAFDFVDALRFAYLLDGARVTDGA